MFSHIYGEANFAHSNPRLVFLSATMTEDHNEAYKWQICPMTHLSIGIDVFCIVKELLEEWQEPFVLGVELIEQCFVNLLDFGLT